MLVQSLPIVAKYWKKIQKILFPSIEERKLYTIFCKKYAKKSCVASVNTENAQKVGSALEQRKV